ncbi:MAG TPA: GH3 auxin-responsive promoter family protein, partial [Opitutaceae bacterium]
MAVVPKSLLTIGAGFLSGRASSRLKRERNNGAAQGVVFESLIPYLAQGFVWAEAGIEAGMDYATFRARVPLQGYADISRHIEAMKKGAEDVLWPGRCSLYAVTSGTTPGPVKHIPVTEVMLAHFRRAAVDSMLWYTARTGSTRCLKGRHIYLGGSSALTRVAPDGSFEARSGDMTGIAALNLPDWAQRHFHEPGAKIAQISDWNEKLAAITERTSTLDISLIAGQPQSIINLVEALRAAYAQSSREKLVLQDLWPRLDCVVHGGNPVGPYLDELRAAVGPKVNFHEVYPASEGFIAAQDAHHSDGLRVMSDAGIFFEFLPLADYDEARLHLLGPKAIPLSEVAAGVDYVVILTTPAGLVRYVLEDVVRFKSTEPARLIHVGQTKLQLNAFGEGVSEKEISDTLQAMCRKNGWTIVSFHVAPFFGGTSSGTTFGKYQGRHEWWVELRAGTNMTPTGPVMAPELDAELRRLNKGYDAKRKSGVIEAPYVRL